MTEDMNTEKKNEQTASALDKADGLIMVAMARVAAKTLMSTAKTLEESPEAMHALADSSIKALVSLGRTREQLLKEKDLLIDTATLAAVLMAVGATGSPIYEEVHKLALLHEMADEIASEGKDAEEAAE